MRVPRVVWVGLAGCAALASLWAIASLLQTSFQAVGVKPRAAARGEPARISSPAEDLTGGRYWNDPSMDPELLKKAFAPPPANLPPEARPVPLAILPSNRELERMRRQGAVAY